MTKQALGAYSVKLKIAFVVTTVFMAIFTVALWKLPEVERERV